MLDRDLVIDVLRAARARGGAFAEVFVEERTSVAIRLDDGKVEELTTGLDRGAGVRVGRGTSFGYAFSNRLDREALLRASAGIPQWLMSPSRKYSISARSTTMSLVTRQFRQNSFN